VTASNLKMKQTERKFIGTPYELQSSKPSPITKEVGSFAAESTPVIGEVLAAKRVIEAAREGKYGEAGIEIVGALLGTVPVVGDVASKLVRETFKKTRKAYKLFVQGKDNKLYPLFVDSRTEIPKGKFIEANFPKSAFQAPNGKLYVPSKGAKREARTEYYDPDGKKITKAQYDELGDNAKKQAKVKKIKAEKTKGTGEQIKVPDATTKKKLIEAGFSVSSPKKGAEHGTVLAVAARPGFHASQFPVATHIGPEDLVINKKERDLLLKSGITPEAIKSKTFFYDKDGKQVSKRARKKLSADELSKLKQTKKFYVKRRAEDHVYAEVEMPTDVDYDKILEDIGETDINDRVPLGGSYKYQDGQADSDSWVVSGHIRVNRILSRDEAEKIRRGLGTKDLPYKGEVEAILNRKFAYGGTIGNKGMENGIDDYIIAKMAVGGEINQITEQEFIENFEALPEEEKSMVETILTQTPPEAIRALATVMGVSLQMTEEPPQEPVQEPQEPMEEPTEEITEPEQEVPQTDEMSPVERQMMALGDQPTEPVATTGPINVEGKDDSGIADDIPMEAQNDSFVVNVEALKKFGYGDFIERIIKPNLKSLEERTGIMIELAEITQPQQQVQGEVPIAISNKEIYIPRMLAEEIGYDLLEKINNRGKKQTEKKLAERKEEQPETSPQQQMQAAVGGKNTKMNKANEKEVEMLARLLISEAIIGEDDEGNKDTDIAKQRTYENMQAVANVVGNRLLKDTKTNFRKYKTYTDVITAKTPKSKINEFSGYNNDNYKKADKKEPKRYKLALQIARDQIEGRLEDITGGATFFYNPFESERKKFFEDNLKSGRLKYRDRIGNHDLLYDTQSGIPDIKRVPPVPKFKPSLNDEELDPPVDTREGLTLEQFNIFDAVDEVGGIGSKRKTKGSMRPGLDRVKEIEAQRYRDAPRGTMVGDRKV